MKNFFRWIVLIPITLVSLNEVMAKTPLSGMAPVNGGSIYLDNGDVFENGFPLYSFWQPVQPAASTRLSEIRAPTLIIRGDKDNPTYLAMTDKIGRGIEGARTVIVPGGTHFINLDKPKEFNRAVLQFLGVSSS